MFTKLTDTNKAVIFSVLVLCMSVGAALLIRFLELPQGPVMWTLWSFTPTVAAFILLLVVTRDGYSKEGWKSLGLHRLGLSVWWIAFGATLLITVAASAVVWATPLASFVVPEGGVMDPIIQFLIFVGIFTVWFALGEEIGMRGYLQPRLLSLGRNRALFLVGLVWATWHMPLIFLAPAVAFRTGNLLLFFPLFYGTILRLPKDLHRQRVACLNRTLCAQHRVEHPESVHPDNGISCVGERLPGGGLRAPDPYRCRDRGHLGRPQVQERYGRSTIGRRGPHSRPGATLSPRGPEVGT